MPTVQPSVAGEQRTPETAPLTDSPATRVGPGGPTPRGGQPPVALTPTPPVVARPPANQPAPPPKPRPGSTLGGLVLSVALIALGITMLIDITGAAVPASIYFSIPLTIVGGGLVVGAWHGRAHGLIPLGIVLSLGLAITASVESWRPGDAARSVTWQPTSLAQLDNRYQINLGNATLDLSAVDFRDSSRTIDVHVSVGNLNIVVPPTLDVTVQANVEVGNAIVFGQQWSGINQTQRTVSDDGTDGPGGGQLSIDATVDIGDLEVRR